MYNAFVIFLGKNSQTNHLQLVFFIIATNWKTIHHINIIVVFQKMENKIKQHLYIFFATVLDNVDIYM